MTDLLEMPSVHDCSATSCAYNHDGCHAFAVSIDSDAACATFLSLDDQGGLDVVAQVGACQRADGVNNEPLECREGFVSVGSAAPAPRRPCPRTCPRTSGLSRLRETSLLTVADLPCKVRTFTFT